MRNDLDRETSPYLLQHKENPVHWQPWAAETLALAAAADKPILLSIGYAACHWCHVMSHESFENQETADLMNALFVNIKVDREERPDIDAIYMNALHLLGQQGGWPLTMFLTPQGEPFWGGTYFPPVSRWGRPSFPDVLRHIHTIFQTQREKILQNTVLIRDALEKMAQPDQAAPDPTDELFAQSARGALERVDLINGGINGAPKFPQVAVLEFLWRARARSGDRSFAQAVEVTLDHMCQGGIYDHLGGGFARYSTDAAWLVPHFEKMLYDNAELVGLLTDVWRITKSPLYAARVRETVAWLEREMIAENGAFAASLDADSAGEEGRFYVWSEAEIDRALGSRATLFKRAYDVSPAGNWEGKVILNRNAHRDPFSAEEESTLAECRAVLLGVRATRVRPGFDDKVLTDWNGLMIAALTDSGAALGRPAWIELAARAFAAIVRDLGDGARLYHAFRQGQARHAGLLDDYANMARAALVLFEVKQSAQYLKQAEIWVDVVEQYFIDVANGGYFLTAKDAEALITRTRTGIDNATPSGNGVMAGVLAKLFHLTGDARYEKRGRALLTAFSADMHRSFLAAPTLFTAFDSLTHAIQIIVVGPGSDATTRSLLRAAYRESGSTRALLHVDDPSLVPALHPAYGKTTRNNRPAAYVCVGTTCSLPLSAEEELVHALSARY